MKNLIKFELIKLGKQKSLYITAVIMIGLLFINVLTFFAISKIEITVDKEPPIEEEGVTEDYDQTFDEAYNDILGELFQNTVISTVLSAATNASYTMIVGIVITLFVCRDYTQGTIKTLIARGSKRREVYFAKLTAVTVGAIGLYLLVIIFGFIFGLIFFGCDAPESSRWLGVLGVQMIAALGTAYLSFFMASIIRKVGTTLLVVLILPTGIDLLLTLADVFLEEHLGDIRLSNYFITTIFASLTSADVSVSRLITALITSAIYTSLFILGGYYMSRKSEY